MIQCWHMVATMLLLGSDSLDVSVLFLCSLVVAYLWGHTPGNYDQELSGLSSSPLAPTLTSQDNCSTRVLRPRACPTSQLLRLSR